MPPKNSKKKNVKRKANLISEEEEKEKNVVETTTSTTVDTTLTTSIIVIHEQNDNEVVVTSTKTAADTSMEIISESTTKPSLLEKVEQVTNSTTTVNNLDNAGSSNNNNQGDEARTKNQNKKNIYDSIRYCIISNDGIHDHLVKLIGLKNLFAKMLPKMPKEYIVRLVMDPRHKSLAILSDDPTVQGGDEEIIGGICYRPYHEMKFGEIAFCAVSMSQQVKGYGTKLMNLLKMNVVKEGLEYLITYADNYAIGYFKKQGFTKNIAMPKGRYHGLIKDYDGGTMMECYIHPSIDYTRIPEMIKSQRDFILSRVRLTSKSDKIVYPPLPLGWKPMVEGTTKRGHESAARAMCIPGVAEAGWTMSDLITSANAVKENNVRKNNLKSELLALIQKVHSSQFGWPFRQPVDIKEVPDYFEIIKEPMDLSTMEKKASKGQYENKKMLYMDMLKMVNNCKLFNATNSTYYECAKALETFLSTIFTDLDIK